MQKYIYTFYRNQVLRLLSYLRVCSLSVNFKENWRGSLKLERIKAFVESSQESRLVERKARIS